MAAFIREDIGSDLPVEDPGNNSLSSMTYDSEEAIQRLIEMSKRKTQDQRSGEVLELRESRSAEQSLTDTPVPSSAVTLGTRELRSRVELCVQASRLVMAAAYEETDAAFELFGGVDAIFGAYSDDLQALGFQDPKKFRDKICEVIFRYYSSEKVALIMNSRNLEFNPQELLNLAMDVIYTLRRPEAEGGGPLVMKGFLENLLSKADAMF